MTQYDPTRPAGQPDRRATLLQTGAHPAESFRLCITGSVYGVYLYTGDAESHAAVVYLIITEVLQQGVADLRETQSLFTVDYQTDDRHTSQTHRAHLTQQSSPT